MRNRRLGVVGGGRSVVVGRRQAIASTSLRSRRQNGPRAGRPTTEHRWQAHFVRSYDMLSDHDFELLVADLLGAEDGVVYEAFARGADQGVDVRRLAPGGPDIIQCKHMLGSTYAQLKSAAGAEAKRLAQRTCFRRARALRSVSVRRQRRRGRRRTACCNRRTVRTPPARSAARLAIVWRAYRRRAGLEFGHEPLGVAQRVGSVVQTVSAGNWVVIPTHLS